MDRVNFQTVVAAFLLHKIFAAFASGADEAGNVYFVDSRSVDSSGDDATPATDQELGGAAGISTEHWAIHRGISTRAISSGTASGMRR